MDTIKLCTLLTSVTYQVYVTQGDQLRRYGSAVAINNDGHLLTAAHVVGEPHNFGTKRIDPGIEVHAKPARGYLKQYRVEYCATLVGGNYLVQPFVIDLARLVPTERLDNVAALSLSAIPVVLGMDVLMAGFSHEIRPAFDFHNKVKDLQADPAFLPNLAWLQRSSYEMMIKRGMIGQVTPFHFEGGSSQIEGDWFHIDNMMHPGASGGPVIDGNGALVGIITHTAQTAGFLVDSPKERVTVPSGSTVAISPRAAY